MIAAPCTDCPSLADCIRSRAGACAELINWRADLDRSVPTPHAPGSKAEREALAAALWDNHGEQAVS